MFINTHTYTDIFDRKLKNYIHSKKFIKYVNANAKKMFIQT